jgi:hypothetical protein
MAPIIYRIIYVIGLLHSLYFLAHEVIFLFNFTDNGGFREAGTFGHAVTAEWSLLIVLYWSVWTIGLIFLLRSKSIGWVLTLPACLMGILYLCIWIALSATKNADNNLAFEIVQLVASFIILFLLNRKKTFEQLKIAPRAKYYLSSLAILIVFIALFAIVPEHYMR